MFRQKAYLRLLRSSQALLLQPFLSFTIPDWFALEVVVSEKQVRDLVPKLLDLGVQGIIEYSLNKVI